MGTDGYTVDTYATGKIYLFYGGTGFDNVYDDSYSIERQADDYLGFSVSSGVDINEDGQDEIIAGMPGNDDIAGDAGGAFVFEGSGSITPDTTILGSTSSEELGYAVSLWQGFENNHTYIIALGAPSYNNYQGRTYIFKEVADAGFVCGDVNNSDNVNILDITYLISYLYKGGPPPDPMESADVNSSGNVNLLDITYLIAYLYKDGPAPDCL
jgi:hypothetical protein